MVFSILTEEEKNILYNCIGFSMKSIIRTDIDSYNRVFGNIALNVNGSIIEIRNELTSIDYFGDVEDVSRLYVKKLKEKKDFQPMVVMPVNEISVNEIITGISIVQDEIIVKNMDGNYIYEITMDNAIIIKTENSVYAFSREWSLEEELIVIKTTDYLRDIYSVEKIISEWSDECDNSTATCSRTEIALK